MEFLKNLLTLRERYPDIFIAKHVDPRTRTRTVPMRVLCLGMSRNGTMSIIRAMKTALEILGIPTYHGFTVFSNPPDAQMWSEGLDAKFDTPLHSLYSSSPKPPRPAPFTRKDWDSLLGHVSAVSDAPAAIFGPELIEAYPEAKIVLVKRDSETWFRSYDEAIIQTRFNKLYEYASWLDTKLARPLLETLDKTLVRYFGAKKLTLEEVRRAAREGYERHYEIIRQAAPKERFWNTSWAVDWDHCASFWRWKSQKAWSLRE